MNYRDFQKLFFQYNINSITKVFRKCRSFIIRKNKVMFKIILNTISANTLNASAIMVAIDIGATTNEWMSIYQCLREILPTNHVNHFLVYHSSYLVDVVYQGTIEVSFNYGSCEMNHSLTDFTLRMRRFTPSPWFPQGYQITVLPEDMDDVSIKIYSLGRHVFVFAV